jgi:hypothetical protein
LTNPSFNTTPYTYIRTLPTLSAQEKDLSCDPLFVWLPPFFFQYLYISTLPSNRYTYRYIYRLYTMRVTRDESPKNEKYFIIEKGEAFDQFNGLSHSVRAPPPSVRQFNPARRKFS